MISPSASGSRLTSALPTDLRRRRRQAPHLHAVEHAARGEEQHRRVRGGDEDLRDDILLARRHARAALAAAALGAIGGERHALDVARWRDGDDQSSRWIRSSSSTSPSISTISVWRGVANSVSDVGELLLDDVDDAQARGEDGEVVLDLLAELLQLVADLVAAERGQARQAQVEDGAGLLLGQADRCRRSRPGGADRRSARPAGRCRAPASRAPSTARAPRPGSARGGSAGSPRRCWRPRRRGRPTRGRGRAPWRAGTWCAG